MKKMLLLGVLVTVVLAWLSLSYKTQDVPAAGVILNPSQQTGWPFTYRQVAASGPCTANNADLECDPPVIHNYFSLASDIVLCVLAGGLTSFTAYRLSRPNKFRGSK